MKPLLIALVFLSSGLTGISQSIYAGEWMGVITPKCLGWGRTTVWLTVFPDGYVSAGQWNFLGEELWDDFDTYISVKGSMSVVTGAGDLVTLKLTKAGKGTGTWLTPFSDTPGYCRQTVTLFREYN